jgi:hypothetical protein
MLKLPLAIFAIWQLAVVIFQYSELLRQRMGSWPFWLCGLLPDWRMFGPRPVDDVFQLHFRIRAGYGAAFSEWRLIDDTQKGPALSSLFFHPRSHLANAMRLVCSQVCTSSSQYDPWYQMLLQHVIGHIRRSEPAGVAEIRHLQFRIGRQTLENNAPLFESHVHSL